jgi:hypothetical protein
MMRLRNTGKKALTSGLEPRLNLIPGAVLILLIEPRCAHAQDRRPRLAPLLYAVGPWEITKSSAAGSLVKRPRWKRTIIYGPGPTHRNRPRPAHSQIFPE